MGQVDMRRIMLRMVAADRLQRIWRLCQNRSGLPRPLLKYEGRNTPLPWVGGDRPAVNQWARVDGDRAQRAFDKGLCIVCGRSLERTRWVHFLLLGRVLRYKGDDNASPFETTAPAPLQAHDQCALIAATVCPHLKGVEQPAVTLDGTKLTHDQLREYVHAHRNDDGHESLRADIEEVNK